MKILKQESEDCRIVQRFGFFAYQILRERLINSKWRKSASLYTGQLKTIDEYASWFDWKEKKGKPQILGLKQF